MSDYASLKYAGPSLAIAGNSSVVLASGGDSLAAQVYANTSVLPSVPSNGKLAYVTSTSTLYYSSQNNWFKIQYINKTPIVETGTARTRAPYRYVCVKGSVLDLNYTVTEPEGITPTITLSNTYISDNNQANVQLYTANTTIRININESIEANTAYGTKFTFTLSASDGVNIGQQKVLVIPQGANNSQWGIASSYDSSASIINSLYLNSTSMDAGGGDYFGCRFAKNANGTANGQIYNFVDDGDNAVRQINLDSPYDFTPVRIAESTRDTSNYSNTWNANGSYLTSLSVGSDQTSPRGWHYKPGGFKGYLTGTAPDSILEYVFTAPYDLSTAVANASSETAISSISGSAQTYLNDVVFKEDGTVMISGDSSGYLYQYNLTTPWDISTLTYVKSAYLDSYNLVGIDISPDGKNLLVTMNHRHVTVNMSTAWDIATVSMNPFDKVEGYPTGIGRANTVHYLFNGINSYGGCWANNGQEVISTDRNENLHHYRQINALPYGTRMITNTDTGTEWSANKRIWGNETAYESVTSSNTQPFIGMVYADGINITESYGLTFNTAGTKFWIINSAQDDLYEFTMSTAWDIRTADYTTRYLSVLNSNSRDFKFANNGYNGIGCNTSSGIDFYKCTTPYDPSTLVHLGTYTNTAAYNNAYNISQVKPDGSRAVIFPYNQSGKMYMLNCDNFNPSTASISSSNTQIYYAPTSHYNADNNVSDRRDTSPSYATYESGGNITLDGRYLIRAMRYDRYSKHQSSVLLAELMTPWDLTSMVFRKSIENGSYNRTDKDYHYAAAVEENDETRRNLNISQVFSNYMYGLHYNPDNGKLFIADYNSTAEGIIQINMWGYPNNQIANTEMSFNFGDDPN